MYDASRTPCQKHDAEISRIAAQTDLVAEASQFMLSELSALRARVASLEEHLAAPGYFAVPILGTVDSDTGAIAWTAGQPPEVTP